MNNRILVSVCMITYNHQNYIKQAIESILSQTCVYNIELIISNDCSTDNTDLVINEIINKNKSKIIIKYFNQKTNLGMLSNFLFALKQCKGKYIALCEGDDYWNTPLKLEKQVDFLEANFDYELCFSNIKVINAEGKILKEKFINKVNKYELTQKDMPFWAPTLTRVFKNRDFKHIDIDTPGLDTLMLTYQSNFGKIKFFDEIFGVYRIHNKGVYNSKSYIKKKEHIIQTLFDCLIFVENKRLKKYAALILKIIIELKSLDTKIFNTYKKQFKVYFIKSKMEMQKKDCIKILLCYNLAIIPIKGSNNVFNKFIKKIINNLLIPS